MREVENMVVGIALSVKSHQIALEVNNSKELKNLTKENVISHINNLANHLDLDTEYLIKNILGGTGK